MDENKEQVVEEVKESFSMDDVNRLVNSAITSRMKSLDSKFEALTASMAPKEQPKQEKQSELQLLKSQFAALKQERDNEVSLRRNSDLRSTTKEALLKLGIAPQMVKPAMSILIDSDKVVSYNEDNEMVFRSPTGDMDLANGVKDWLGSEDGKVFKQPLGASGSGGKQVKEQQYNKEMSRAEVASQLELALLGE